MSYTLTVFLLSIVLILPSCNSDDEKSYKKAEILKPVDDYFLSIPSFSGNVLIAQHNKVIFSKSYGYADQEFTCLNQLDTKFKIGSITKTFTALAILKLLEDGKLLLSDSVGQHLSNVPPHWKPLTIHQLLTHTSGLIHSWDILEDSTLMFERSSLKNTLEWYFDKPLKFEPGTSFYYSGVGYLLLANIIEVVTQLEYNQYLKENIFTPLDMQNTGVANPQKIIQNLARGYIINKTGSTNAPQFYAPLLTGGGHLYSTTQDLFKWDRALSNHSILSEEMTNMMFSPVLEDYGYGWNIIKNDTLNMVFHTGFIPGYLSRFDRYIDHDICLVILCNYQSDWSPVDSWKITNIIFEELQLDD